MDPLQLVELLRGHRTYIQTHNFPDPDAIASAFGLQHFLNYHGIKADICYDGKIERLSTRKMFDTFHIDILSKEDLDDMKKEDYIVTVDSQKYNANLTDFIGDSQNTAFTNNCCHFKPVSTDAHINAFDLHRHSLMAVSELFIPLWQFCFIANEGKI